MCTESSWNAIIEIIIIITIRWNIVWASVVVPHIGLELITILAVNSNAYYVEDEMEIF